MEFTHLNIHVLFCYTTHSSVHCINGSILTCTRIMLSCAVLWFAWVFMTSIHCLPDRWAVLGWHELPLQTPLYVWAVHKPRQCPLASSNPLQTKMKEWSYNYWIITQFFGVSIFMSSRVPLTLNFYPGSMSYETQYLSIAIEVISQNFVSTILKKNGNLQ